MSDEASSSLKEIRNTHTKNRRQQPSINVTQFILSFLKLVISTFHLIFHHYARKISQYLISSIEMNLDKSPLPISVSLFIFPVHSIFLHIPIDLKKKKKREPFTSTYGIKH